MGNDAGEAPGSAERLAFIRAETRFEIGLLHDRVNALVTSEAFLTIAYTAAMSNGAAWGARFAAVVAPILSLLGLLLAVLAWPGIDATVAIVLELTARQSELLDRDPALEGSVWAVAVRGGGNRRAVPDQRRSTLFFRVAPGLFALVWVVLTVVALVIRR